MAIPIRTVPFNFTDGLSSAESPIGSLSGFRRMKNAWLAPDTRGAIEPVPGWTKENDASLTLGEVLRSIAYTEDHANDERICVVRGGTKLWRIRLNDNGTELELKGSLPNGKRMAFVTFGGKLLCFDGSTTPFEVEIQETGTPTVQDIGLTRPDVTGASSALNAASTGNVEGIVKYFVSHVDSSNNISALSEAFGEIDAKDGKQIDLSGIPLDSASGKARIYRTAADGSRAFYLTQVEGTAGGTTTYTDDTEDALLGGIPTLHGDPPPAEIIDATVLNNRVYGITADGDLYYTDQDEYASWFVLGNQISVYKNDGDEATAIVSDSSGLIIFKKNHAYRIQGETPSQFQVIPLASNDPERRYVGCPHHQAVVAVPGGFYFYHNQRLYSYSASRIRTTLSDIDDIFLQIDPTDDDDVGLSYFPKYNQVWVSLPVEASVPTRTYLLDLDEGKIVGELSRGTRHAAGVTKNDGSLEFWTIIGDNVFNMFDDSYQNDGSNLNVEIHMPEFHGTTPGIGIEFCRVDVIQQLMGSSGDDFDVRLYIDGDETTFFTQAVSQATAPPGWQVEKINIGWQGITGQVRVVSAVTGSPAWRLLGGELLYQQLTPEVDA